MSDPPSDRSRLACVNCKDGSGCRGGDGSENRKTTSTTTTHNKSDGIRFHHIAKHLLRRKNRPRGGGGGNSNKRSGGGGSKTTTVGGGGCWCFKESVTLESYVESETSDPNSKDFSHEMVRVLIEKNDFCSKECNPHLD